MTDEIYHLQIDGEQRGPYTRRQIDHQLNSGLIPEQTLYHREGMDDWAPVTALVALRRPRRKWKFRGVLIAFVCFLLVLARFFGPVVVEGWREAAQFQFTEKAAYWRAREAIRHQALPANALVRFGNFQSAHVVLEPAEPGARARVPGVLTGQDGKHRSTAWDVSLQFDHELKQWTAASVLEEGQ